MLFVLTSAVGCGFQPSQAANPKAADGGAPSDNSTQPDAKLVQDAAACADDDHDGVCNAVDDWPCGAKPPAPPVLVLGNGNTQDFRFQNLRFQTVASTLVVMTPQQAARVQFNWMATETECASNCIDQMEVGFHLKGSSTVGKRVGCLIDQAISKSNGSTGTVDTTVVTPTTTGVFELRAGIAQNYGCNLTTDYYSSEPSTVMALFCITP